MQLPKKRVELFWIGLWVYWLILTGGVLPYLISAPQTALVIAGAVLFGASAYTTYRLIAKRLKCSA